jgi:MFS family permease
MRAPVPGRSIEQMSDQLPRRLLLISVLTITASALPVFLVGAAFIQMGPELGFSAAGLGVLTAVFFLSSALASAPLGRVVERIGWRTAIRVNAAVAGLVLVTIGTVVDSAGALIAALLVGGLAYGFANPAANRALADHVDPRHAALVFGLKHAGIPVATLLAGLAVPLIVLTLGWRFAYAIGAILAVIIWWLVALTPRGAGNSSSLEVSYRAEDPRRSVAPLVGWRLAGLSAGASLATLAAIALGTFLVAAAVDAGFSESAAGLLLFAGSVSTIAGRVVAGVVTDRIGGRGFGGLALLMGTGAVLFLLLPRTAGVVFGIVVLGAFATAWGWPGLMTYTLVNANRATAAASSGITQAGVFAGAGGGPLLLGFLVERYSFSTVWVVVAGALIVATILVVTVGRHSTSGRTAG